MPLDDYPRDLDELKRMLEKEIKFGELNMSDIRRSVLATKFDRSYMKGGPRYVEPTEENFLNLIKNAGCYSRQEFRDSFLSGSQRRSVSEELPELFYLIIQNPNEWYEFVFEEKWLDEEM